MFFPPTLFDNATIKSNEASSIFTSIDAVFLGVDDDNRLNIIQAYLSSDYEEEEATIKREKRGEAEYRSYGRRYSLFSEKYIHHSNKEERMDEDSKFGKKSGFSLEYHMFCFIHL